MFIIKVCQNNDDYSRSFELSFGLFFTINLKICLFGSREQIKGKKGFVLIFFCLLTKKKQKPFFYFNCFEKQLPDIGNHLKTKIFAILDHCQKSNHVKLQTTTITRKVLNKMRAKLAHYHDLNPNLSRPSWRVGNPTRKAEISCYNLFLTEQNFVF